MSSKEKNDLIFGSELEKFILNHASLRSGDRLEGKVIQVKANGKILIHFGQFRAVAESNFTINEGEIIHVVVVAKYPKLKLRLETPQIHISNGIRNVIGQLEILPENKWTSVQMEIQRLLGIKNELLLLPEMNENIEKNTPLVKLKVHSQTPLRFSLLFQILGLNSVRIDFFLVNEKNDLNITYYVTGIEEKEILETHIIKLKEQLKVHFNQLIIHVIISKKKVSGFESENLRDTILKKVLDVKV